MRASTRTGRGSELNEVPRGSVTNTGFASQIDLSMVCRIFWFRFDRGAGIFLADH